MADESIVESLAAVGTAPQEQIAWLILLGGERTIAARNFYEVGTDHAEGTPLRGFNEIQHRVYGRITTLQNGDEWTTESFWKMLRDMSRHFHIEAEVKWAIRRSLSYKASTTIQ